MKSGRVHMESYSRNKSLIAGERSLPIEGQTFYDFHIHQATEKYQEMGAREDTFAQSTDRFADFQEAIGCMIKDCGFEVPFDPQGRLFEET